MWCGPEAVGYRTFIPTCASYFGGEHWAVCRISWENWCHLSGAWSISSTSACGSATSTRLWGWLRMVWRAASWRTATWEHCQMQGLGDLQLLLLGFPRGQRHLDEGLGCAHGWCGQSCAAAKTLLLKGLLDISSRDQTLPLATSDVVAARLLDIAILCGNVEAATNLAKTYQARPLRRWGGSTMWFRLPMIAAALSAGAKFQELNLLMGNAFLAMEVPLFRFVPLLFKPEHWQQLGHFFPSEKNRWPTCDKELSREFLSKKLGEGGPFRRSCSVSMQKIQNALRAGWDLKYVKALLREGHPLLQRGNRSSDASFLDVAILYGQLDCAVALGSAGVELRVACLDWHRRAFRGESLAVCFDVFPPLDYVCFLDQGSALKCQSAASAAARALLTKSFQREGVEKGIALYQTLKGKFHSRGVPMAVVRDILGFSMEAPKILDQLDLWDQIGRWTPFVRDDDAPFQEDDRRWFGKRLNLGWFVSLLPSTDCSTQPSKDFKRKVQGIQTSRCAGERPKHSLWISETLELVWGKWKGHLPESTIPLSRFCQGSSNKPESEVTLVASHG